MHFFIRNINTSNFCLFALHVDRFLCYAKIYFSRFLFMRPLVSSRYFLPFIVDEVEAQSAAISAVQDRHIITVILTAKIVLSLHVSQVVRFSE